MALNFLLVVSATNCLLQLSRIIVVKVVFKFSGLLKCASGIFHCPPAILHYQSCARSSVEQAKGCFELFTEKEWVRGMGLIRE